MKTNKKWCFKILLGVLTLCILVFCTYARVTSKCACESDPAPIAYQQPVQVVAPAPTFVVQRPAPVVFSTPAPVCGVCTPAYKTVKETVMQEHEVTTYETVWDEETRYATRVVSRQVPETSVRTETVKVQKPVWETVEKETAYDVVRYVPETSEREEVQTVKRPVCEVQEREIVETVKRPVQQTVMQQRQYTVNRAVTSCQTQVRDEGRYVTRYTPEAPREYRRLTWQRGGEYFDPVTGTTRSRLPGLYWTELQGAPQYKAQQVYEQNLVARQVPVTTYVPETVVEDVPVNVTTYQEEQIVRKEQVPVTRYVEEKQVKKIPVTTYKPVTERVVQKTPVKVCRIQTEEQVRQIPVTTYKTVREEIKEPYKVRIARTVPKTVKVQRPVTVYKQVPIDQVVSPCGTTTPCGTTSMTTSTTVLPAPVIEPSSTPAPSQAPEGKTPDASVAPSLPNQTQNTQGGIDSRVASPLPGPAKTLSTEGPSTATNRVLPAIPTPVPETSSMFASDKAQGNAGEHTSSARPIVNLSNATPGASQSATSPAALGAKSASGVTAAAPPITLPKAAVADTAPSLPADSPASTGIRQVNHVEAKVEEAEAAGEKAVTSVTDAANAVEGKIGAQVDEAKAAGEKAAATVADAAKAVEGKVGAQVDEAKAAAPAVPGSGNDQFLKLQRPTQGGAAAVAPAASGERFDSAKPEEMPVRRPMPTVSPTKIFTD